MVQLVAETDDQACGETPRTARSLTATMTNSMKTVPMPRSLPELQQLSALHLWGGKGPQRLRFYHQGREILHATQLNRVQEHDTIVVKVTKNVGVSSEGNAFGGEGPAQSTQKADFIKFHNVRNTDTRPAENRADGLRSHLADLELGKLFDGFSLYQKDYTDHPNSARAGQNLALQKSHFTTSAGHQLEKGSTYTDHFRAHKDHEPIRPINSSHLSVISSQLMGQTFDARSSYHKDFYRPPSFKPSLEGRVHVNDNDSSLTDLVRLKPFKGQSTYNDHYIKFKDTKKNPSCRPIGSTLAEEHPFTGGSEYNDMYNEQMIKSTHTYVNLLRED